MKPTKIAEKLGGAPHSKQSLRLWLRLFSCSTIIEKKIRLKLAEEFDTTLPRFDVLSALDRMPEGLTMGELSSVLLVSNGNVTSIVKRLSEAGLVDRTAEAGDRRVLRVRLTTKGREDFRIMADRHEQWIDQLMSGLSDDEISLLLVEFDRVRASVQGSDL